MNAYERAAHALLESTGVVVIRWRPSMTGVAHLDAEDRLIEAPRPRGPISFGVLAHEVGHQQLHRATRHPRWLEEVQAEDFALRAFGRFGLRGRERYERKATR